MAMVFKSKKETSEILQKDYKRPGPGDYLPQTIYKKINPNKKFITTSREDFYPKNLNPGPGQYFQNETPQLKKNETKSNKSTKSKINFENIGEIFNDNESNNNKKIQEKLGFNIKAIRFKPSKDKIEQPGPGQYFPDINKFFKTNLINKINEKYKPRKVNNHQALYKLIPSIPSKNQQYGFNILEDGNIVPKKAPNFNQTFTGVKGDTVGPGYYEIDNDSELYKSRPKWTLSKDFKNTMNLVSTNFSDNSRFLDNSNLLSSITANKFFFDDNLNIKELSPYNISSNSFTSYSNSYNFNNLNKSDNNLELMEKLKNKIYKFKRIPLSFTSNGFFHKNQKDNIKKKISRLIIKKNTNPGPGQYINQFKISSFNCKSVPESYQFFGSNARRFNYKYYLNDEKETINTGYGSEENNLKKIKELKTPFSTSEERLKPSCILIEKSLTPGPDQYFVKNIKKIKSFSNFNNFGSGAKRFIEKKELKWKKDIPGPGMYNPEKIKGHIKTNKMIKKNGYINKKDLYIDKLNYNIKTIEYENYKKSSFTNLKNVTFYRTNPSLKKSNSCKNINPPPGLYYVNKLYEPKQIISPFNSSSNKNLAYLSSKLNKVGPGHYIKDSYFGWNKKSFNITYI